MKNDAQQLEPSFKYDAPITGGLMLLAFSLYMFTLAPTVLEADAGEFQFVPWIPGIAHPTGYPLYILMGWLWSHLLPIGQVAWRMNLLSAVLAALAVGVTYLVAHRLLNRALPDTWPAARAISAAVAAATFATTHTFWSQAIIAEVYALHSLFVVTLIWLALKVSPGSEAVPHSVDRTQINADKRRFARKNSKISAPIRSIRAIRVPYFNLSSASTNIIKSGGLLAVTFGLGLTHHVTTILFAPAILLYLWWTRPPDAKFLTARRFITICGLIIAPLLLYLYLPLAAPSTPYASVQLSETQTLTLYNNSVEGFFQHVTGAVFTGQVQPAAVGIERVGLTWQLMRQQFGWVGAALMLIGLFILWTQRRIDLLILTGVAFIAVVSFNLIYFIGDVFVLFIPAWLIACLWLGIGVLGLVHRLAHSFVQRKMGLPRELVFERLRQQLGLRSYRLISTALAAFFFVLPLALLITRISDVNQRNAFDARNRWQQILAEPIPNRAILISNDRNEIMPMWYYQFVEKRRTDLQGLFPLIVPQPDYDNVAQVLDQALASGRPVYLTKPMDGLSLKANLSPEGSLFRAEAFTNTPTFVTDVTLPPVEVTSASGETTQENISLLGYDLSSSSVQPGDTLTVSLYWRVIQNLSVDYTSYVHLITPGGEGITQSDHRPGGDYYASSMWRIDEILRDAHTLTVPADATPGSYRLRVGLYYQPQPGKFKGMGNGLVIGTITIEKPDDLSNVTGSQKPVAESSEQVAIDYRLIALNKNH